MCLSLVPLTSNITSSLPILVELMDFLNSVIFFLYSNDLTKIVNFPTLIPESDSHNPTLLDLFLFF